MFIYKHEIIQQQNLSIFKDVKDTDTCILHVFLHNFTRIFQFVDHVYEFAGRLQELLLTDRENALLMAVLVMNPGNDCKVEPP